MEAIGIWGEFLGGLGVIISLIFLAQQIRVSNKLAIAACEREIMSSFSSINELQMGTTDASIIMSKLVDQNSEFNENETEKARAFARRMANVWLSAEASYTQGFLTDATYQIVLEDIKMHLKTYPAMQYYWLENLNKYPSANSGLFEYSREVIKEINTIN